MTSFKTKVTALLFALVIIIALSCKNNPHNIPFPSNVTYSQQPLTRAIIFSDEKPFKLDQLTRIKPSIRKFNFNTLPVRVYDSSGFQPFKQKPDTVTFDWNKLPDTVFNYDKLHSLPLRFSTSIQVQPQLIKAGPPRLIRGTGNIIYELEIAEGLDANSIRCIYFDKAGFLWIATDKGLYRYDGENFLLYNIIDPNAMSMVEDARGQIWMTSFEEDGFGLGILNPNTGTFKRLLKSKRFGTGIIFNMLLDGKGRIWTTTDSDGVEIFDESAGTIKQINRAHGLSDSSTYALINDQNHNLWISTSRGINIIDLKNGKIRYLDRSSGLSTDSVTAIKQDNKNLFWLAGISSSGKSNSLKGTLSSLDIKSGKIVYYDKAFSGKNRFIVPFSVSTDFDGKVWVGDYPITGESNGTIIIDPANESVKALKTPDEVDSFHSQRVLTDAQGQVWTTTRSGLNMVRRNGNHIQHIGNKDITTLYEHSGGKIWIGSLNSGIDIFDNTTGLSRSFTKSQGLSHNTVEQIIEAKGSIFIGSYGGLDIIDSLQTTIRHIGRVQGLSSDSVLSMFLDNRDILWISPLAGSGADLLDLNKNTVQHLSIGKGSDSALMGVLEDRHGRIWFTAAATGAGLINLRTNTVKFFKNLPGLSGSTYKVLLEDKQGNVWIGGNQGIYCIKENMDSFTVFSTREGLLSNNIISANEYRDKIYVGTNNGLNILTPTGGERKNWKVESYRKTDGFNKLIENYNANLITKEGKFIWGDKGLVIADNLVDTFISKTYITGISIANQPQYFTINPWQQISDRDTLWSPARDSFYLNGKLPASHPFLHQHKIKWDTITAAYAMPVNLRLDYDENYLQFHFSQANLGRYDTAWYSYILEGIDKTWSRMSSKPYSDNYLNLPPGRYTLSVRSKGSGNVWSEPAELKFTILPPWWQTWWFRLAEAAAAFAIGFWMIRLYVARKLTRQKNELKAIAVERERIASDMHDDLGSGLTSIRLLSEVANLKTVKESAAKADIEKIVKAANVLSENLREIIWTMNTKYDKLADFIIYVRGYSVEFLDNSSIHFQFNQPESIPGITIPGELRRNIFLCIKEALNNIIKHSHADKAELSFKVVNNILITEIKDNGRGIDTSRLNKFGNGLNGIKERLNKYGSILKIDTDNGTTLTFEIVLPQAV